MSVRGRACLGWAGPLAFGLALASGGGCDGCHKKPRADVAPVGEVNQLPLVTYAKGRAQGLRQSEQTIAVGGKTRPYLLIEPTAPEAGRKYPLVFVLHGDGGTPASLHRAFPFESASGPDAVVVYPNGAGGWDLETPTDNRDVKYISAIVDELAERAQVDKSRVFAMGYSNGGFFANVLACQGRGLVRAISSSAGGAPYNQKEKWPNGFPKCPDQAPVATIVMHGDRDTNVTPDSGRFSAEYWAFVNGCHEHDFEATGYEECVAYRGCQKDKPVVYCTIPTLGHWIWDRGAEASWTFFLRQ